MILGFLYPSYISANEEVGMYSPILAYYHFQESVKLSIVADKECFPIGITKFPDLEEQGTDNPVFSSTYNIDEVVKECEADSSEKRLNSDFLNDVTIKNKEDKSYIVLSIPLAYINKRIEEIPNHNKIDRKLLYKLNGLETYQDFEKLITSGFLSDEDYDLLELYSKVVNNILEEEHSDEFYLSEYEFIED